MAEIATTLIAALGGILIACVTAGITYWLAKTREREAELRKEKLEHYKDFVASLSGIISGEYTLEGKRAFSRACNKLNLVAPQSVVKALQDFQQESKISNTERSNEKHDQLMSRLFYEMRKDLQITPKDEDTTFVFGLWAAGVPPTKL
jgi:hypothetical protein